MSVRDQEGADVWLIRSLWGYVTDLFGQFQRLRLEFLLRRDNELNQIDDMPRFDFVRRVKLGIRK